MVVAGVAKLGYTGKDAKIIVDVLLYAQLRGNNQGIAKIATGGIPRASDIEEYRIVKQTKCASLVSGGNAMVATKNAAKLATQLAREHGIGLVGLNHTFSSSGAVGYFSRQIAEAGYIGLICVGTRPFVAPHGSSEAVLGTNPLSYAFPTSNGAIVFDMATSAIAGYGVVEAKLKGEPLPEGIAYDKAGNPTIDAAKTWDGGSIVAFGEHKGFGLSLLVQLLAGPFVGAAFAGMHNENGAGTFILAIDPELLVGKKTYVTAVDELIGRVKNAKALPDYETVTLPGEHGDKIAEQAKKSSEIEIADAIWRELGAFVGSYRNFLQDAAGL